MKKRTLSGKSRSFMPRHIAAYTPPQLVGTSIILVGLIGLLYYVWSQRASPLSEVPANTTIVTSTPSPVILASQTPKPSVVIKQATPSPVISGGGATIKVVRTNGANAQDILIKFFYPENSNTLTQEGKTNTEGSVTFKGLTPGVNRIEVHYDNGQVYKKAFTIENDKIVNDAILLSTSGGVVVSPSTDNIPPPRLDAINGPYDWGDQGTCFTLNGDQVHDGVKPLTYSWKLDGADWSGYAQNDVIKCYQGLSSGTHSVGLKAKDGQGRESNQLNNSFTK